MVNFPVPNDLDAEAAVLSAILLDDGCLSEVASTLQPEHFYSVPNRRIYETILKLANARKPFDIVSLASSLRDRGTLDMVGGTPYLAQLSDATPSTSLVTTHADIVREKWRIREFISRCHEFAVAAPDTTDVQTFIERAEREISQLAEVVKLDDAKLLRDVLTTCLQIADASKEHGGAITGIATGIRSFDAQVSGLHDGDLYIVAARPGMGKTSFVLSVALNVAATEGGVLFCSLEMPAEQLGSRVLASNAGVSVSSLRAGKLLPDEWSRLTEAAQRSFRLPLYIDDSPGLTLHKLRAKIRRVRAQLGEKPLKLVAVDYLQLMSGPRTGSREQEISELTRGLKGLAKEEKLPIVVLSQLNRAVETRNQKDKRPQLSDLRESGAIEQDADAVFFLYRDEYYNKETDAKGVAEVIVAKQRNGPTGTVFCRFTGEYTRFEELLSHPYDTDFSDYHQQQETRFNE